MLVALKPRPNDSNISAQHIPTMLAQHLQALATRSQHFNATDRNIVGDNMLRACCTHVMTCCELKIELVRMLGHNIVAQNLAKRLQYHATSTNVAWKI